MKNNIKVKILLFIVFLLISGQYGCANNNEDKQYNKNTEEGISQVKDSDMEEVENNEPIDYAALQEDGHQILYENICINPKSAYENSWLMMQLESELDLIKRQFECLEDSPIEYFVFDFDDDGEEEFIVSFNGSGWSGSGGNVVYFLKKNPDGSSKKIYDVNTQLYAYTDGYNPLAILDEKKDGYYKFVLPWSNNRIWEYDAEKGIYDSDE